MKQPRTKVAAAVAQKTLRGGITKHYSREVAAYLLSSRRTNELSSLIRDVQADWADAGEVQVIARSAFALSSDVERDIQRLIRELFPRASHVVVNEVHDPELIGGVRLSLADRQLDLTLDSKLQTLRRITHTGKD